MKLSTQTRLKLIEAIAQVPKESRVPEVVVMIVQRVLFESEGEKFDEVPEKLSRVIEGEGKTAISRPPNVSELMDKVNELVDYLQAHHGKGNC